jgi:hypothetical protein
MAHDTRLNLRLPVDLWKKLKAAAFGQSPKSNVTREIVERLTDSFNPRPAGLDGKTRPIRHFRTLIDRTARVIFFEIDTEDGVSRFNIPADDFQRLATQLSADVHVLAANIAAGTIKPTPIINPPRSLRPKTARLPKGRQSNVEE